MPLRSVSHQLLSTVPPPFPLFLIFLFLFLWSPHCLLIYFLPNTCQNDEFQLQAPLEALLFSVFTSSSSPPSSSSSSSFPWLFQPTSITAHSLKKPIVQENAWKFYPSAYLSVYWKHHCTIIIIYTLILDVLALTQPSVCSLCPRLFCSNSLRKLSAGHNQLQKLPERVERPLLEVLDVQHNQLVELPCNLFLKSDR